MIRFSMLALAVASFCFVAPVLRAEEAPKEEVAQGVVKSVAEDSQSFVIEVAPNQEVGVIVEETTKFTDADGKEVKMADVVKKGAKVKVTHKQCKASKVEACKAETPKP